jgi:hypothetical protein
MREPDRPDLSPLDLRPDSPRWERVVRQIMLSSAAELLRRRAAGKFGLFDGLLAWARPALATAAALVLLSVGVLSQFKTPKAMTNPVTFFESPGMPQPVSVWLEEGQPPLDLILISTGEN